MDELLTHLSKDPNKNGSAPALFVGHGSPMNAIEMNTFTQGWKALGESLPHPKAILMISAHWISDSTMVHTGTTPKTIHDFWGFPKELYDLSYPAPGSPSFAHNICEKIDPPHIHEDHEWGLDHGAWVPLLHMYPKHDIPTFQMSINAKLTPIEHYALGEKLCALREQGVLIMGSGNIVHNLKEIRWEKDAAAFSWAEEFDEQVSQLLSQQQETKLIAFADLGESARLSIPTPDHFWPLLYVLGAKKKNDVMSFPIVGLSHGSISMRSVLFQ